MSSLVVMDGHSLLWTGETGFKTTKLNCDINLSGAHYLLSKMAYYSNQGARVAVVFDSRTSRKKVMENYKGNRSFDPGVAFQAELVYRMLKEINQPVYREEGKEGDDLVFDVVLNNLNDYELITVLSGDKDLGAVITDNVNWLSPRKDGMFITKNNYEHTIQNKAIVPYNSISFYKMIYGDHSDNISELPLAVKSERDKYFIDFIKFCDENGVNPFFRSFKIIIDKFIKQLGDGWVKEELKNRAEVIPVRFTIDEKYKIDRGLTTPFLDVLNKLGLDRAYRSFGSGYDKVVHDRFISSVDGMYRDFVSLNCKEVGAVKPKYSNHFSEGVINGF